MTDASKIKEHMEVIGADGVHLGTVDRVEKSIDADDSCSDRRHRRYHNGRGCAVSKRAFAVKIA
jgi:Uncharacterized protein conserved in bacteria (DUF2171)